MEAALILKFSKPHFLKTVLETVTEKNCPYLSKIIGAIWISCKERVVLELPEISSENCPWYFFIKIFTVVVNLNK